MRNIIKIIIFLITSVLLTGVIFIDLKLTYKNFSDIDNYNFQAIIKTEKGPLKTIIFVGDVMLDRVVEQLINKNGVNYPFEKIADFLQGADLAIGNLEGPINKNPVNFPRESLKFSFAKENIKGLIFAGFDLFSLANNHTLNMGQEGLDETRELLKQADINFFGDPLSCDQGYIYQENDLIFLGFNKTYPSACPDNEIINTIDSFDSEKLLIINIHWGEEYQLKNSTKQQELAYKMIDAGADLIIGHHPHVVQNHEIYSPRGEAGKDRLIFYSLGNFVFDQYFSEETQKGLAVKLEIYLDKFIYKVFSVSITDSQPKLFEELNNFVIMKSNN